MTVLQRNLTDVKRSFDLTGNVALVVGGYGAIGRTISTTLAEFGATTVIAGRNAEKAQALAEALAARGCRTLASTIDGGQVSDISERLRTIVAETKRIDIFVNCLGLQREQRILEVTEAAFDEVYRVNLKAGMFLAQEVARHQVAARRGGKHIHLLSLRSLMGVNDRGYSAFCSSKGGMALLVRQHAAELAQHNITVNGVAPGTVHTEKNDKAVSDRAAYEKMIERIPLRRLAEPADVAGAVLFMSSPASNFVTGQILCVDGGATACQ